ncbi:MAG TPA: malto-oligosyltrehalose trehalohydrolase [Acidimicrobiia bacterium]|nr:malto-oligosyltrehalose trehalohydrolase [Acidimicrobiia bacterium]
MTTFSVWAPAAVERVDLVLPVERRRIEMAPASDGRAGWWAVDVPEAGPGTDYQFSVDAGPALPDPRSPFQPDGVHGPSRVVDHGAFEWTDALWRGSAPLSSALVYEAHVGTFTPEGTFDDAVSRIPHLVELGVTHLELLPVAEFPGSRGWGYDGVDLFAPHHAYGGPDGLKRLVDACHAAGLGVIIDVVYNHLGPDGNYLGAYGPYFTDRYNTPWGDAVNYDDAGSDEVRNFVCDNACHWLEHYHADGLRLDAVHAIFDSSAVHILEELARRVAALEARSGQRKFLIAESDLNDPRLVRAPEAGGYGLDAAWSDDFHHALHSVLTGETSGYYEDFGGLARLGRALERGYVYAGDYSAHRGRRHGRPLVGVPASRLLGYLQNHDQVGNRATGERSSALMSTGRLHIAAALVLCSPFVPMLFQGEEWGASTPFQYFTDHIDAELGRLVSEGRRREFSAFGWKPEDVPDPQDRATFERSVLDWAELGKDPHTGLLEWHRSLVALRRRSPALTDGDFDNVHTAWDEQAVWFALTRGPVTVACNLADHPQAVPIPAGQTATVLLASAPSTTTLTPGAVTLPPDSVAILAPRD